MEMISEMSESWIVDDVSSSDGGDLSTWEIIDDLYPDLSDSETETETPGLDSPLSRSLPKKKPMIIVLDKLGCNNYCSHRPVEGEGQGDGSGSDRSETEDDGVDDELVPRGFGVRLERNRMRKLGKREYSRMATSKKLPVLYNKPGCLRGKHGLGLKHSLI